ncbi:hypothetical protein [Trichococcus shcherbakoviae]|uniref:hypothetical protein n=1 Tax=Trichococcus shcherbakoviae TaxID=2094020 RepID=UPI002AA69B15|nr:hypothetical protein [Trichococcus shcherbakoviae]
MTTTYVPRFCVAGCDTSAPSNAKLPVHANHGSQCLTDDLLAKNVYDAAINDKWLPEEYIPFCYDFSVHGGAVGDIDLGVTVPANTIILDGILDVVKAVTVGTNGTIALKVEAAGDVLAAVAAGTLTKGRHDIVPVGTAATSIKTTVARKITATIATAAVTAGRLYGFLRCVRGVEADEGVASEIHLENSLSDSEAPQTNTTTTKRILRRR